MQMYFLEKNRDGLVREKNPFSFINSFRTNKTKTLTAIVLAYYITERMLWKIKYAFVPVQTQILLHSYIT